MAVINGKNKTKSLPKLADIAQVAGVSIPTVAKALHGTGGINTRVSKKTATKIRAIARKMGYRPNLVARQLAGKRSQIIGVIIDSYAPQVAFNRLAEMERQSALLGYRFMVGQSHGELDRILEYIEDFDARGVDGVICISHNYPAIAKHIDRAIANTELKAVFIGRPAEESARFSFVDIDIADGIVQAIDHLHTNGKSTIGIILPKSEYPNITARYKGYLTGLSKNNIPYNEDLLANIADTSVVKVSCEIVKPALERLLDKKVDAIICSNDRVAVHTIKLLHKMQISIPQEIAIVGYDNLEICEMITPELTSIDQNPKELAQLAVNTLVEQIEQNITEPKHITIKPKLVIRETT